MPTRDVSEGLWLPKQRIAALRDATRLGLDDLEAGHYRTFETPEALRKHLQQIAAEAIAGLDPAIQAPDVGCFSKKHR